MAATPNPLIETPDTRATGEDVLSSVLRTVRISGSLQFCFMPSGAWQTDAAPSLAKLAKGAVGTVPFHIVAQGSCWLKIGERSVNLAEGDVVAFPFGTGHQLGAGQHGSLVTPVADLPAKPWRSVPALSYGDGRDRVRLLCGYLQCDALNFAPLRNAMPDLLHARTAGNAGAAWLRTIVTQIVTEADRSLTGGMSLLERLSEVIFIELLRGQMIEHAGANSGWLAALGDRTLSQCLAAIHGDPARDWSVDELARLSGVSRTVLTAKFASILGVSPMRYARDWRLYLASAALRNSDKSIAAIGFDAGYGTEAAFSRAFSRSFGMPPATWRQRQG